MAGVCIINKLSARAFGERKIFDNDSCQKFTCVTFGKSNKTSAKLSFSILLIKRRIFMKASMSISKGQGSLNHNRRKFISSNVDKSRVYKNIILLDRDIKDVYKELFDSALDEYNGKQKRKDRQIKNYYEHINRSKQEKPFYELIIQLGNKDNPFELNEVSPEILTRVFREMQKRYSYLEFIGAYIHNDEHTPHIHIDYIPVAHNQKRGLSKRVSHNLAMKEMGFDDYKEFRIDLMGEFIKICKEYGIEREIMDNTNKHLSVKEFKEVKQDIEMAQNHLDSLNGEILKSKYELNRVEAEIANTEQNIPFYKRLLDKALIFIENLLGISLPINYEECETYISTELENIEKSKEEGYDDIEY